MFKKIVGLIYKYKIYIKYIIAGGTAAATDLFLLFLFHDIFKINVVVSATLAFVIAFFVSFYLQKFWTFSDNSRNKIKQQMGIYFFVGVINAGINAIGMDFLVNKLQIWYILSQVIMCGSIALYSFIIYNLFIFKKSHQHNGVEKQSSRTNVLIATGIYPPDIGGPATYVKTLQEELPKYGSEVRVVTYADDLRQENGVLKVSRQQNIFFRYWQYFWIVFKLCSWAGIIYVQGPVSEGLPAFLACKLRIKKYLLKIVGDYAWEQGKQRFGVQELLDDFQEKKYGWQVELMRFIQKIVARNAKVIITPSNYLKGIIKKWGIAEGKIIVMNNSVEQVDIPASKEELRKKLNINGIIICSVGRLVPWKGFDILIEMMPDLLSANPDFKLFIFGDGLDKQRLNSKIKELNLEASVKMMGSKQQIELWEYMKASDFFILNTGYEGLPHLVIEAMQLDLPVITTRIGGNLEVIVNNENGFLVEYNNQREIEDKIFYLLHSEEIRKKIVTKAKDEIKNKFSREKMIDAILMVFNKQ